MQVERSPLHEHCVVHEGRAEVVPPLPRIASYVPGLRNCVSGFGPGGRSSEHRLQMVL